MKPTLLLFGHELASYTLMAALGVGAAALYLWRSARHGPLPGTQIVHIGLFGLMGGVVGAKLLYLLVMLPSAIAHAGYFRARPGLLAGYLLGGMVFYGGLLGGLLAGALYCRHARLGVRDAAALFTPAVPLFHAFGRVGCLLAGCCHGLPYAGHFAVHTPAVPGGTVFPIQAVEAFGNILLFVLLAWLARRLTQPALVLPVYLLLYGGMRFALEFWRGDSVRGVWILSTSQWISLLLVLISTLVLGYSMRKARGFLLPSTTFDKQKENRML